MQKNYHKGGNITNNKYLQPTTLYEQAEKRYKDVCRFRDLIEKRVKKYPAGKIHIVQQGKWTLYYFRENPNDKSGKYISKKDKGKINLYLQKKYDESALAILQSEKKNLERFLKNGNDIVSEIRNVYSQNPNEIKNIINPIDISDEDYENEWQNKPFKGKEVNQSIAEYITNRGEHVRSKSELTIANALEKYGIPYKYECPLLLSNGITIHPDFTILNIRERRDFYWEHRGMMDDREYAKHAVKRLKELELEGIIPGYNLIITEETQNFPLGTDEIERIIKRNFITP